MKKNIRLIQSTEQLINYRQSLKEQIIGFVPTMGNLHNGHLRLMESALKDADILFVSIFVNPTQFGEGEDFEEYPRTLGADLDKIATLETQKDIIVFSPSSPDEIYPEGFSLNISMGEMTKVLCGASRSGHFDGVCTVVYQLFSLVKPNIACFGEKDFQQLAILKVMVRDMRLPINIVAVPIVRDEDGLALSSRNQYLDSDQRKQALELPETLKDIEFILSHDGVAQASKIAKQKVMETGWEYLEILDANTLLPAQENSRDIRILGAFKVGTTRLIDNRGQHL